MEITLISNSFRPSFLNLQMSWIDIGLMLNKTNHSFSWGARQIDSDTEFRAQNKFGTFGC